MHPAKVTIEKKQQQTGGGVNTKETHGFYAKSKPRNLDKKKGIATKHLQFPNPINQYQQTYYT